MIDKPADARHPIHDLMRTRFSPRAFTDRAVEPESLLSILEAARWSASSFNEQPWAFFVATRGDAPEFERLAGCLSEGNAAWARRAPVLLLSVAKLQFDRNGKPNRHAYHDVGLATAHVLLQATALGLSAHAMAGFDVEKSRQVLGIPAGWDPVAAIALGYRGDPSLLPEPLATRELAPRTRKPLESFVYTGAWGRVSAVVGEKAEGS
jgi:nitroreductase